ncbi:hypothetical protein QKW35_19725 [Pontibacterium granulatum]|uniref:hypothetical protein n=1 Tax=Pontibacterium granulatum TaxID=2036029 RepID=UPI002499D7C4|nr:hypothetical protein [Pontibacterium granulatum]MDI3326613.1 hypothetical protein [Pontibacterium granulatum]
MTFLPTALLSFLAVVTVTSPINLDARFSNEQDLLIAGVSHALSAPGMVAEDPPLEFADDSNQADEQTEKTEAELKDEEMRRLYLKLLLMKGVGH